MNELILRELNDLDEPLFLRAYDNWKSEDPSWLSFVWTPGMKHQEHLQILKEQKDKAKIPAQRVPSTMLYGFAGGEIVGRVNIRHELNDFLLERGGHIGYGVVPSFRRRGYAKEMLGQGLSFCQKLGLEKILITCSDENTPSWKIIERFGGVLENKLFIAADSEMIRRYWLHLK